MNASSESGFASASKHVTLCPVHCRYMFYEQDYFSQVLDGKGNE